MTAALSPSELARRAEAVALAREQMAQPAPVEVELPPLPSAAAAPADPPQETASSWLDNTQIDQWYPDGGGLTRWRPVTDHIAVVGHPGDARTLALPGGYKLKFTSECAAHLAWQLMPAAWRDALRAAGLSELR